MRPGFLPYPFSLVSGRPKLGDPLYVSTVDGPEIRLISQQLRGSENYSVWAQEFRRECFIEGSIPVLIDERMARQWKKCNQLMRTWIGNCISPEIVAGLPPTEDSKRMWDNIREMYGKLDRAKKFP